MRFNAKYPLFERSYSRPKRCIPINVYAWKCICKHLMFNAIAGLEILPEEVPFVASDPCRRCCPSRLCFASRLRGFACESLGAVSVEGGSNGSMPCSGSPFASIAAEVRLATFRAAPDRVAVKRTRWLHAPISKIDCGDSLTWKSQAPRSAASSGGTGFKKRRWPDADDARSRTTKRRQ